MIQAQYTCTAWWVQCSPVNFPFPSQQECQTYTYTIFFLSKKSMWFVQKTSKIPKFWGQTVKQKAHRCTNPCRERPWGCGTHTRSQCPTWLQSGSPQACCHFCPGVSHHLAAPYMHWGFMEWECIVRATNSRSRKHIYETNSSRHQH